MINSLDVVGEAEIAERLRLKRATVHAWAKRNLLPPHEWTVSGQPAWRWSTIEAWAQERFGVRRPILEVLARGQGAGTSTIAMVLKTARRLDVSGSQVARALNGMYQEGLVGRAMHPHDWVITPAGREALDSGNVPSMEVAASPGAVFWTHPLDEGGPHPVGVRMRVRRVSPQREAEVKSPNGEPVVRPEGVLVHSYYPPQGFESWDNWFTATAPSSRSHEVD